jgi:hypothetical protein
LGIREQLLVDLVAANECLKKSRPEFLRGGLRETEVNRLGADAAETRCAEQSRGNNANQWQQRGRFRHRHRNLADIVDLRPGWIIAPSRFSREHASLELVCARYSGKDPKRGSARDWSRTSIGPCQVPKARIVGRSDQSWGRAEQRCGKRPPGGLRRRNRLDRAKIVNREKVVMINRLVDSHIRRIIPAERRG